MNTKAKPSGDRWREGNLFSCDVQKALPSSLSQQPNGLCWLHSVLYCGSCCASPGAKRQWTYAMFPWQHGKNQFDHITYLIIHIYEVLQVFKRQNSRNRSTEQNHCLSNLIFFFKQKKIIFKGPQLSLTEMGDKGMEKHIAV